jgi:TRAP-type C4-dicarboxylate transport system permease small subunit
MEVEARSTVGSTLERVVTSLSKVTNYMAAFALVLMMLLSVSDVLLRSIFKYSVPDSQELIQYLMVCVGFLAMAWRAVRGGHVSVDLVVVRFSPRWQAIFVCFSCILGLFLCFYLSWRTFLEAPIVEQQHAASLLLEVPAYPFYFIAAIAIGILALVILMQLVQSAIKAVRG